MSTLREIKTAIGNLNARDKALLAAELFAINTEPDAAELKIALQRGLRDVKAGRVRPIEEIRPMIPRCGVEAAVSAAELEQSRATRPPLQLRKAKKSSNE
jgi:hypothetical protein